ncbi:MAG: hypothetical protein AB8B58_10375 [Roseobacter sp.]
MVYKTGHGAALTALHKEAEETVLPRHLTFDHGAGKIILEIADRRFLWVTSTHDGVPQQRGWTEALRISDFDDFLSWLQGFVTGVNILRFGRM